MEDYNEDPCVRLFFAGCFHLLPREKEKPDTRAILAVHHSFSFKASSVRGRANPVADALSRFQFQRFQHLAPQADLAATPVPQDLLEALLVTWRTGAISSSPRASLPLHVRCTSLHSVTTLIFVVLMGVLVLKVLFSQPTSSPSCVLPQCWLITLITPLSRCSTISSHRKRDSRSSPQLFTASAASEGN